jgi:hypothetical protein
LQCSQPFPIQSKKNRSAEEKSVDTAAIVQEMQAESESMESSSQKQNKSDTSIEELPNEIFETILSFVKQRRYLALVNKKFYRAVCNVDNQEDVYKLVLEESMNECVSGSRCSRSRNDISQVSAESSKFDKSIRAQSLGRECRQSGSQTQISSADD